MAPELQMYPHCPIILPSAFSSAVHKGKIIVVCNMIFLYAAEEKVLGIIILWCTLAEGLVGVTKQILREVSWI